MMQTRYKQEELLREPWPHICPDCKGEPVRILRTGQRVPFGSQFLVCIGDRVGPEARWVIRCDLCMGTGTVFK